MRKFLTCTRMRMKLAGMNLMERLKEERGDTNFVSIILIIVIVIAIAAIFRDQLTALVEKVFSKLTNFIDTTGN